MSTVSDELERIALSRNDQSERDELLKLWPAVLLMESERAAVGRLNKRVVELETKAAEVVRYLLDEVGIPYSAADLITEKLGIK